jgi:dihydroflavonol-4-reductase
MTTLVTGATGFLGSHVARLLVERGVRVRVLVRRESRLDAIRDLPCDIVPGDLRDAASLAAAVRGVDRVFHVAADYRFAVRDPRALYDTNVAGTRNLLAACKAAGTARVVHTSSVATIRPMLPGGPLPAEGDVARLDAMVGHYKRSKLLAEQAALAAAADGVPVVIVNPSAPVGPGDWKPTPTGRIVVDFMRGKMVAYVRTGLNVVPVEDVAAGHLLAAEHGRVGERYILGGRNLSLKEIFDALAAITGRPAPAVRVPHAVAIGFAHLSELLARARGSEPAVPLEGARMARYTMFVDTSKARRELGFEAGCVRAALERAVRWYADHGYAPSPRALGPADPVSPAIRE